MWNSLWTKLILTFTPNDLGNLQVYLMNVLYSGVLSHWLTATYSCLLWSNLLSLLMPKKQACLLSNLISEGKERTPISNYKRKLMTSRQFTVWTLKVPLKFYSRTINSFLLFFLQYKLSTKSRPSLEPTIFSNANSHEIDLCPQNEQGWGPYQHCLTSYVF